MAGTKRRIHFGTGNQKIDVHSILHCIHIIIALKTNIYNTRMGSTSSKEIVVPAASHEAVMMQQRAIREKEVQMEAASNALKEAYVSQAL